MEGDMLAPPHVVVVAEDRTVRPRWDHHQGLGLLNPFDQLIRIIPFEMGNPFLTGALTCERV
jgi:hypothetical protein